jgi:superfamily II DNA or RNA helicase
LNVEVGHYRHLIMRVTFPRVYAINRSILKNPIRQLFCREQTLEGNCSTLSDDDTVSRVFTPTGGGESTLLRVGAARASKSYRNAIGCDADVGDAVINLLANRWISHFGIKQQIEIDDYPSIERSVLESWKNSFRFSSLEEVQDEVSLRKPQLGAIHAAQAHWSISSAPATIVMPTGTGKTDTMLSLLVLQRFRKLMVVVPTDALRHQVFEKFLTLGILKQNKSTILANEVMFPVICLLRHKPKTIDEVDLILGNCQVIITTSSILGRCPSAIRDRMAGHCDALFIDEAHHAEASSWKVFKEAFRQRKILQFTATPFREDGKRLDGLIIFKYPLRQAQEAGYFKPINFRQVIDFGTRDQVDRSIAAKAIAALRESFDKGHILMARTQDLSRAREVFEIYKTYTEFNPVELHTGITSERERDEIRTSIISGKSRIIVCVDMLGEGFDLPELKIAAFHDIRKTLAVTLQIAGRFTRSRPGLGEAVFIANTAEVIVQKEISKLYMRDPDWNHLLPLMSDKMIDQQQALQDFLKGFADTQDISEVVTLKDLRMATSAVVYRTTCTELSHHQRRTEHAGHRSGTEISSGLGWVRRRFQLGLGYDHHLLVGGTKAPLYQQRQQLRRLQGDRKSGGWR